MNRAAAIISVGLMSLCILMGDSNIPDLNAAEKKESEAKVVFYVACYDVGERALKDLKGVVKIKKGFKKHREINTVSYDPEVITVKKMEEALKEAGTYRETEKQSKGAPE